jgi:hypothetical protein
VLRARPPQCLHARLRRPLSDKEIVERAPQVVSCNEVRSRPGGGRAASGMEGLDSLRSDAPLMSRHSRRSRSSTTLRESRTAKPSALTG